MSSPFIPSKTIKKMKKLGLSETQVMDVFNKGESKTLPSGMQVLIRKYNGYEIGIGYVRDLRTGEYIITTVWKRERR